MIKPEEVYQIGRIGKPHGVKGEMNFMFTDDVFDRTDSDYLIIEVDGILVPFFIEEYRFRSEETALLKLCDIDTQEQARQFTNCNVFFERSHTPGDEEELTWSQIVGFHIVDENTQKTIGTITAVDDSTENVLFELLTADGREVLLSASNDLIAEVDNAAQTITMTIPEGLLEL